MLNFASGELLKSRADFSEKPHPHWVIDDFLTPRSLEVAHRYFDESLVGKFNYDHASQKKQGQTDLTSMHPELQKIVTHLCSREFTGVLEELTGETGLHSDVSLHGGGLHQTNQDGFLKIHKDFGTHPQHVTWRRRYNLILYLTKDYESLSNDDLELWSDDLSVRVRSIKPKFNRAVIFETTNLFHGHPNPLQAPVEPRKSIALYYFVDTGHQLSTQSTKYRGTQGDSYGERLRIYFDSLLVAVYNVLKRKLRFSDKAVQPLVYAAKFLLGRRK